MYTQNNRVSYFTKPVNTKSEEQVPEKLLSLFEVYSLIIGEGQGNILPQLTQQIRSVSNPDPKQAKDERNLIKKRLPHIVFGGEFSHRSIKGLIKSSDLIILDFDHIGTPEQVEDLKRTLSGDTELNPLLLFVSPSGDGLKVVVPTKQNITGDPDFKSSMRSLSNYIGQRYGLEIDPSGKDISRTCFLSYDPLAIYKDPQEGFDIVKWTPVQEEKRIPQEWDNRPLREKMRLSSGVLSDLERAEIAVEDIESSGVDITGTYYDWMRVGFALSTLGEAGRDLFHRVSRFHPDYSQKGTDEQFDKCLSGQGNGVKLETLFYVARDNGIRLRGTGMTAQEPTNRGPQQAPQGQPVQTPQVVEMVPQQAPVQTEFPDLLKPTTEDEMILREMNLPDSLLSGYMVEDSVKNKQRLLIPSGKLTGIAGATGHGKSLFLLNTLLNVAKKYNDRRFVLFTYEENSDTIIQYLLNIYLRDLNLTISDPNVSTSNRIRLKEYFRKDSSKMNRSVLNEFELRKNLFFKNYIENGRILIKYVDSDSSTLCQQIRYLSRPEFNIGGIFIDYFQCINPTEGKRFPSRQEALKSICFELKDIANETGFPVVLACQFNQEVLSPTDVQITRVGEAGDISRIVSELWGLWQLGKDIGREVKTSDKLKIEDLNQANENLKYRDPFLRGMYVKVLKSRFVETGSEQVLSFRGLTGKIYPNDEQEREILSEDWENSNDLPFN